MAKPDAAGFRRWLIERVSESRWPVYRDDTDEAIAKRIGVQVEVLVAAREVLKERTASERVPEGQRLGMPRSRARARHDRERHRSMVFLEPPREVYEEWMARCERLKLPKATLLRSVCHYVLQLSTQPTWVSETRRRGMWVFRGKWFAQADIREHRYRLKCELTDPAFRALALRAENTNTSVGAIARWGVCLLVAGKLEHIPIVGSLNGLYKEPSRYCVQPQITG